tara:strand:- start:258 stop:422 length:165 start_codon:yes stop_codon:yes gene_type:complete
MTANNEAPSQPLEETIEEHPPCQVCPSPAIAEESYCAEHEYQYREANIFKHQEV